MTAAADALGVVRLAAAFVLPSALARAVGGQGRWWPALLFAVGAASDFFDGVLARRGHGATRHGAVLDNLADIAFVLAGTVAGATLGLVPRAVPLAIGLAFASYAAASLRGGQRARSAAGHTAGWLNYALVGLITGAAAVPGRVWVPLLATAGWLVIGVNLAAVLSRVRFGTRSAGPREGGGCG
ncbi:MAG TPA: CDP-alcohol phosphatidyltransferase family protein [Candidatus Limnocylindria bacterium]|nr:CDP-alcohol phosphatidyltransferase family protein [Candidatus Limnocylindria bacterium]